MIRVPRRRLVRLRAREDDLGCRGVEIAVGEDVRARLAAHPLDERRQARVIERVMRAGVRAELVDGRAKAERARFVGDTHGMPKVL